MQSIRLGKKKKKKLYEVFVTVNHLKMLGNNIAILVVAHPHGTRVLTLLSAHAEPTDVNVSAYRSVILVRIFVKYML